jgi:hypothetical protein
MLRYDRIRYGTLETSDKNGLPAVYSHRNPKKIGFLGWVLGIPPNPKPNPKNPINPILKPTPNPNKMGILGVKFRKTGFTQFTLILRLF